MKGNILIVDDQRSMCELIETDVRLRGYTSRWFTSADEAFATGVFVCVIQFLPPEYLRFNRFEMAARLPEPPFAILRRSRSEGLQKASWTMHLEEITQRATGELAKIRQCPLQSHRIPLSIKYDQV